MINLYEVIKNQPQYFKQLTCKDLLFTQYDCPQIERKESFFNELNYIAYVLSGKRTFHRNGKSWALTEGVSVFVKKGAHIAEKALNDGWCVMVFFIPDEYLCQFIKSNRNNLPLDQLPEPGEDYVLPLDVDEVTRSFFFSMLPYFTLDSPPNENLLELKFNEMILAMLSNKKNKSLLSYLAALSDNKRQSLHEIMESNYTFHLSLAQYAKLAHMSLPTFKRTFKNLFQINPGKWILNKRIEHSKALLRSSQMSVSDIAYDSGFENPAHFSRVFKEKTGSSPVAFRQRNNRA